jgi:RNA polymerase sigma factor (sigma-70 family)
MLESRFLNGQDMARLATYTSQFAHYPSICEPQDQIQEAVAALLAVREEVGKEVVDDAMLRVAANRARERLFGKLKKQIKRSSPQEIATAELPERVFDRTRHDDLVIDLRAALEHLSPEERRILSLKEEGCSNKSIAKALGVNRSFIDKTLRHAKSVLAGILRDWNPHASGI